MTKHNYKGLSASNHQLYSQLQCIMPHSTNIKKNIIKGLLLYVFCTL